MPVRTLSPERRSRLSSVPTDTATMTRHYLLDAANLRNRSVVGDRLTPDYPSARERPCHAEDIIPMQIAGARQTGGRESEAAVAVPALARPGRLSFWPIKHATETALRGRSFKADA